VGISPRRPWNKKIGLKIAAKPQKSASGISILLLRSHLSWRHQIMQNQIMQTMMTALKLKSAEGVPLQMLNVKL
jgi:hypothetical protein